MSGNAQGVIGGARGLPLVFRFKSCYTGKTSFVNARGRSQTRIVSARVLSMLLLHAQPGGVRG